jgi:hypothetical protein
MILNGKTRLMVFAESDIYKKRAIDNVRFNQAIFTYTVG